MTYGWAERDEFHNFLEFRLAAFYRRRPQLRNVSEDLPPHVDIEPGEIKDEDIAF